MGVAGERVFPGSWRQHPDSLTIFWPSINRPMVLSAMAAAVAHHSLHGASWEGEWQYRGRGGTTLISGERHSDILLNMKSSDPLPVAHGIRPPLCLLQAHLVEME